MEKSFTNTFQTPHFEKKLEAEIVLLRQRKKKQKKNWESTLSKSIANAEFEEPFKKRCIRYIRKWLALPLRLPLIGPCLKPIKALVYDPWKNSRLRQKV